MSKEIKIFRVDDCDWYAAETEEEAIQAAMADSGESREYYEEEKQGELSAETMLSYKFTEEDGNEAEKTFRQKLDEMIAEGQSFPCCFACTEC